MLHRCDHRAGHYPLFLLLGGCLFFLNLGGPSLWDLDEGRNATCALEMLASGNWVIPTFNGLLRPDKPALLYWLQLAAYHCCGVDEFAARLPSALAALATILLCYELARSMFSRTTGLLAGIIVACTPMLCGAARFANPDALLNGCIALTLALFWVGWHRPRLWWFAALGVAVGLGMLAKGAVAVVLPVGIIAVFFLWQRQLATLVDGRQLVSAFAFGLVALPWYIRVGVETKGEFIYEFFLNHHVDRFLDTMENHRGGIWYYPVVIILGTIPWSIFLGPALWYGGWSSVYRPWPRWAGGWSGAAETTAGVADARTVAAYRLLLCWIGLFLVFFTVSATKLPNYALPVVVPTAILLARFLERWRTGTVRLPAWVLPTSLACLALTGAGLTLGLLAAGGALPLDAMHGQPLTELRPFAVLGLLVLAAALTGLWCLRAGLRSGLIAGMVLAGVPTLALLGGYCVPAVEAQKAPRALVAESGACQPTHDIRVAAWQLDHLPSLNFYVERGVHLCKDESEARRFLQYPLPVYLFLPVSEWEHLRPSVDVPYHELGRRRDLYKHEDVVVISNR